MKGYLTRPLYRYPIWSVPRAWEGKTCAILAGGPSLKAVDLERVRSTGCPTIVINRSFRLAPWATVLYFCDPNWWTLDGAEALEKFSGEHIITIGRVIHPRVRNLRNSGTAGLETRPDGLKHGTNSGYQSINLAYHFGARRIVLFGYDMRTVNGETHAHAGYGTGEAQLAHVLEKRMLPYFPRLVDPLARAGVEVFNASRDSALECWPKVDQEQAIALLLRSRYADPVLE